MLRSMVYIQLYFITITIALAMLLIAVIAVHLSN